MGTGLAISRSIIEVHGGRIRAIPNTDRGLTIQIELPSTAAPRNLPSKGGWTDPEAAPMLFAIWVPLLTQVLIALGLLAWLGFGRPASRIGLVLRAALVATYIIAVALGGLWLVLPWYTPLIYGLLFLLVLVRSLRRWRGVPTTPPSQASKIATAGIGALLLLTLGVSGYMLNGRQMPSQAVRLSFPLRGGTYLVVNGGRNQLVSGHVETLEGERFRPWRGQSYGVDIVKIGKLGLRASGILPADPVQYEIFGEPLCAPCSGEVITAMDGVPDMSPPQMDRQNMAGNHVILDCQGVWILMGHLQRGSVRVRKGGNVTVGQPIGRIGNTGNTFEPHLHIHAQRPGSAKAPLSGDPLHIQFDGRYPARNSRFTKGPAGERVGMRP